MYSYGVSDVLYVFAVMAFVLGLLLTLTVITKSDCALEADRANTVRAQLLLLVAFVIALFALLCQRTQLVDSVRHLLA